MEAQQAEAALQAPKSRHILSNEEAEIQRKIEGLRLVRTSIVQQLARTSSSRYRALLQDELKEIDFKLQRLPELI